MAENALTQTFERIRTIAAHRPDLLVGDFSMQATAGEIWQMLIAGADSSAIVAPDASTVRPLLLNIA